MVTRRELNDFLYQTLRPDLFQDYGPNGLQIEGIDTIKKIAFSVSATKDSVQKAIEKKAQALIVHHGLFWKFHGPKTITGAFAQRVKPLIEHNLNLWGYHLPLDAHIEYGNAACLAKRLGLQNRQQFGDYKGSPLGVRGEFSSPIKADLLKKDLESHLDHVVLHSKAESKTIKSIGIITGGANNEWSFALSAGLDAYLTGEMSEHNWHEAKESGIHMFAGGHHATERFGIQSLMEVVRSKFALECFYIESDNPA